MFRISEPYTPQDYCLLSITIDYYRLGQQRAPRWPLQKPITVSDIITLDNISVQQVEVTKFLGVLLDQHLSWIYHKNHAAKKVSKTIVHLGPKLWNSVFHNLTQMTSQSSFKTSLKEYLIERAIN